VSHTPAGATLLGPARGLLAQAEELRQQAKRLAGSAPVRLGYVDWLPADLAGRTAAAAQVHLDAWVAPSHTKVARVANGGLDLAICWISGDDLERLGLAPRLAGHDRLYAISTDRAAGDVAARDTVVLLDDDTSSWASWNAFAEQLARDTGADAARITNGGITGPAFHDHVRRSGRLVVNSPKGQDAPVPPGLVRRPIIDPEVHWTWLVVRRANEHRAAVLAVVDALCDGVDETALAGPRDLVAGRRPLPAHRRPVAGPRPRLLGWA
jgi:DNA-binding transcriptional LysR family regulator